MIFLIHCKPLKILIMSQSISFELSAVRTLNAFSQCLWVTHTKRLHLGPYPVWRAFNPLQTQTAVLMQLTAILLYCTPLVIILFLPIQIIIPFAFAFLSLVGYFVQPPNWQNVCFTWIRAKKNSTVQYITSTEGNNDSHSPPNTLLYSFPQPAKLRILGIFLSISLLQGICAREYSKALIQSEKYCASSGPQRRCSVFALLFQEDFSNHRPWNILFANKTVFHRPGNRGQEKS